MSKQVSGRGLVSARIRRLVRETGSQRNAAKQLGITVGAVNDLLHGRRLPSERLCRKLGLVRKQLTMIEEAK